MWYTPDRMRRAARAGDRKGTVRGYPIGTAHLVFQVSERQARALVPSMSRAGAAQATVDSRP